jgi:hypothetical protein
MTIFDKEKRKIFWERFWDLNSWGYRDRGPKTPVDKLDLLVVLVDFLLVGLLLLIIRYIIIDGLLFKV